MYLVRLVRTHMAFGENPIPIILLFMTSGEILVVGRPYNGFRKHSEIKDYKNIPCFASQYTQILL